MKKIYLILPLLFGMILIAFFIVKEEMKKSAIDGEQTNVQQEEHSHDHFENEQKPVVYEEELSHEEHLHDHEHGENESIVKNDTNKPSKNFTLKTVDGDTLTLNDLKGKKVFLNFWATWCPPCREEMPEIQRYYETYGKKHNVEVVAVNITDQDNGLDVIKEFVDYYQLTFPIVLDEHGEVSIKYEIFTIPTSYVINEQGNIVKEIIGPVTKEMLVEYFK